jgi:hypothetical protein
VLDGKTKAYYKFEITPGLKSQKLTFNLYFYKGRYWKKNIFNARGSAEIKRLNLWNIHNGWKQHKKIF